MTPVRAQSHAHGHVAASKLLRMLVLRVGLLVHWKHILLMLMLLLCHMSSATSAQIVWV